MGRLPPTMQTHREAVGYQANENDLTASPSAPLGARIYDANRILPRRHFGEGQGEGLE